MLKDLKPSHRFRWSKFCVNNVLRSGVIELSSYLIGVTSCVQVAITILIAIKFGISGNRVELPKWYTVLLVVFICLYMAGFAWSWGPLGWLVPSEIFPLEIRSAAQGINVSLNMLFTFVIAQTFLAMLCSLQFGLFVFFSFWLMLMSIAIKFFLPETKGIPIEEMDGVWRTHWFWNRFVPEDDDTNIPNWGGAVVISFNQWKWYSELRFLLYWLCSSC